MGKDKGLDLITLRAKYLSTCFPEVLNECVLFLKKNRLNCGKGQLFELELVMWDGRERVREER